MEFLILFILIIKVEIDKVLATIVEQDLDGGHPLQQLLGTSQGHHPLDLLFRINGSS